MSETSIPRREDHKKWLEDTAKVIVKKEVTKRFPQEFAQVYGKAKVTRNELFRIRSKYKPYLDSLVEKYRKLVRLKDGQVVFSEEKE